MGKPLNHFSPSWSYLPLTVHSLPECGFSLLLDSCAFAVVYSSEKIAGLLRLFNAPVSHEFVRRFPKCAREHPVEVKRRKTRLPRGLLQRHPFAITRAQIIPRPA